jgi:hypothetical protein
MKQKLIDILLFLILLFVPLFSTSQVEAVVIIHEFSSASTTEWIELLNTDQNNSVNLGNFTIKNASNNTLKAFTSSDILPRGGFLTFEFTAGSITDNGDCLILRDNSDTVLYAISFGTGSCGGGGFTLSQAPLATETVALINDSWQIDTTPSRGWCNDNTGGCPTISNIVMMMTSENVTTNLDSQSDLSRTTNLYFEKSENGSPVGKISFLSEINFTDRDALSWMENLGQNINMDTRGVISLNADLIKNLVSTNAQLTMYSLVLNDPTIRVNNTDGTAADSGIVSGLSYNRSNGTLTFTAAHFTTFTAVERSTSSSSVSSTSSTGVPGCSDLAPHNAPDLFQIDTTKNSAKLYFTPVAGPVSYYYIAYGFLDWNERYGVSFDRGFYTGVLDFTINALAPNTQYYFKVRGGNGCAPGAWSNILAVKTEGYQAILQPTPSADYFSPTPNQKHNQVKGVSTENIIISATPIPTSIKETSSLPISSQKSLWQKVVDFILRR